MELSTERKEIIIKIVQKLYLSIDRTHTDPVHGIAEMRRLLEMLKLLFPNKDEYEYSTNIMQEFLSGDRVCE